MNETYCTGGDSTIILKGLFAHPYVKFVAKKIVFYLIVSFVALNFVFFIPRFMPGNPVDLLLPRGHSVAPGVNYNEIRLYYMRYFGLDKPIFPDQYINFWGQLLRGDLGDCFPPKWPLPVAKAILPRLPYTLALVIPVLILSFFLGNWIGAKAAFVRSKWSELVYFFSVFSNQLPSFWFGMVLVFLLAMKAGLFPHVGSMTLGRIPAWDLATFIDVLWHYCLPFLSLFIVYLGGWATGMRSMIIHEMDSGYVRYSEQLGFRKNKLMSYAKRNAILPQFTGINLYLNALIGETIIIEIIFGWPGIGRLMYDAVMSKDSPLILGCFLVIMVVVIFGNFLVDILYAFMDPRIRTGRG
jgi:peptide/nickel transport system permease protein